MTGDLIVFSRICKCCFMGSCYQKKNQNHPSHTHLYHDFLAFIQEVIWVIFLSFIHLFWRGAGSEADEVKGGSTILCAWILGNQPSVAGQKRNINMEPGLGSWDFWALKLKSPDLFCCSPKNAATCLKAEHPSSPCTLSPANDENSQVRKDQPFRAPRSPVLRPAKSRCLI